MDQKYKGIFAANTTPFKKDGTLDVNGLASEIDYLIKSGIDGFFAGGTYGEGPMMSVDEYADYITIYTKAINGRVPVIAQIGSTSLAQAIKQAESAETANVDALAAIPPYYYPHDENAILDFYQDLCKATSLPLFIYNNPWRSGNKISPSLLGKLAKIPRVIGMKDSSDSLQEFCKYKITAGPEFNLFIGNDDMTLGAFIMGAQGGIIVLAGLFPDIYTEMYKAFKAGNIEKAKQLQNEAIKIRMVLKIGPYVSTYKALLTLLGRNGGYSKKPIRMPSQEEMDRIKAGLKELGRLK